MIKSHIGNLQRAKVNYLSSVNKRGKSIQCPAFYHWSDLTMMYLAFLPACLFFLPSIWKIMYPYFFKRKQHCFTFLRGINTYRRARIKTELVLCLHYHYHRTYYLYNSTMQTELSSQMFYTLLGKSFHTRESTD